MKGVTAMSDMMIVFWICGVFVLPLTAAEAFRRLLKLGSPAKCLPYFGLSFMGGNLAGKLLARMMSVVLQRQIAAGSLQYCLCALAASSAVTFVLAVLKKNIQISVEFQNE